jgi:hypothetical protein
MSPRATTLAGICLLVAALPGSVRAAIEDERPRGRYVFTPPPNGIAAPAQPQRANGPLTLFLNRCPGGIQIVPGATSNSSANQSTVFPNVIQLNEYPFGDAAWAEVVAGVREIYAPFGIMVTDIDPAPADHHEALVCGSDAAAGISGAAGIAPFDCTLIPNAITFTFPETIGNDPTYTISTIAQESAHAFGLDHEFKCDDPMTYLDYCGDYAFQDGDYPCGEYEPRQCMCGGATQNSYQWILGLFGAGTPDTQLPLAAITYPADGDVFAPGDDFQLTISVSDDVEVHRVFLYADGVLSTQDDSAPFTGWSVTDVPAGTHELYLEAEDASGNIGVSDVVTIQVGDIDGGANPGESGGSSDGGGTSGDGGSDPSDGDDAGPPDISGGQIPPGFGRNAETNGCMCTSAPLSSSVLGWSLFVVLVRRRRTRSI